MVVVLVDRVRGDQTSCIGKILQTNDKRAQCMNGIWERKQKKVTASSHTTDDDATWNSEYRELGEATVPVVTLPTTALLCHFTPKTKEIGWDENYLGITIAVSLLYCHPTQWQHHRSISEYCQSILAACSCVCVYQGVGAIFFHLIFWMNIVALFYKAELLHH